MTKKTAIIGKLEEIARQAWGIFIILKNRPNKLWTGITDKTVSALGKAETE